MVGSFDEAIPPVHLVTDAGGPLPLSRELADRVQGRPVHGGHFFPEEHPQYTAAMLGDFFRH